MKGSPKIIATRDDLDLFAATDPKGCSRFCQLLAGSAVRSVDTQQYPDGYKAMGVNDEGYLPPVIEQVEDTGALQRYGFATMAELDAWVVEHLV